VATLRKRPFLHRKNLQEETSIWDNLLRRYLCPVSHLCRPASFGLAVIALSRGVESPVPTGVHTLAWTAADGTSTRQYALPSCDENHIVSVMTLQEASLARATAASASVIRHKEKFFRKKLFSSTTKSKSQQPLWHKFTQSRCRALQNSRWRMITSTLSTNCGPRP